MSSGKETAAKKIKDASIKKKEIDETSISNTDKNVSEDSDEISNYYIMSITPIKKHV